MDSRFLTRLWKSPRPCWYGSGSSSKLSRILSSFRFRPLLIMVRRWESEKYIFLKFEKNLLVSKIQKNFAAFLSRSLFVSQLTVFLFFCLGFEIDKTKKIWAVIDVNDADDAYNDADVDVERQKRLQSGSFKTMISTVGRWNCWLETNHLWRLNTTLMATIKVVHSRPLVELKGLPI